MRCYAWVVAATMTLSSLAGCGGGSTDEPLAQAVPTSEGAPSGLVVGYYLEDPTTNPEDPMPGTFYMNLPEQGAYSGSMYFTYVGCQNENVGTVNGNKQADGHISGTWAGTVDGTAVGGGYEAMFDAETGAYTGTFTNAAGKVEVNVAGCIRYHVAPNGTIALFPVEATWPASFALTQAGDGTISWSNPAGGDAVFITAINKQSALQGAADTVLERFFEAAEPGIQTFDASPYKGSGQDVVVLVVVLSEAGEPLAYSSVIVR